jgi:predicted amidophosphoribosyltransferase
MYCPRCGAENADNRTLCLRCRKPLAIHRKMMGAAWWAALRYRR